MDGVGSLQDGRCLDFTFGFAAVCDGCVSHLQKGNTAATACERAAAFIQKPKKHCFHTAWVIRHKWLKHSSNVKSCNQYRSHRP